MRVRPHRHACQRCGAFVECCGDVEQNVDGHPTWTCAEFHLPNGTINADFCCEACQELIESGDEKAWAV